MLRQTCAEGALFTAESSNQYVVLSAARHFGLSRRKELSRQRINRVVAPRNPTGEIWVS
jgi:hypothetical protein